MTTIRALAALAVALAAALVLAACGGGNKEDPHQVLHETFSNPTSIRSGTFDLDVRIETSGGDNPGKIEAKLGGRFQGRGPDQFPAFDFDVSLHGEGGAQSFTGSGGLTSTGTQAFLNFMGTDYAVPRALYDEFTSTYAQLQSQSGSSGNAGLLRSLGIDPTSWLTDLKNEGTSDVEGTKTIHVSGSANVPVLVDDLKKIAARAGSAAGNINPAEFDRLKTTIKSGDIDVYTGESDKLLRRLQLDIDLKPSSQAPGAPDSLTFFLQLNLADVNKPQTIRPPANSQPLAALLQRFGVNAGKLGNALRGGLGTSGALPESGGSVTPPSASATQAYQRCLSQASGTAALQRCARLLGQ